MSKRLPLLKQLQGAQLAASDPSGHAALSASAGTGKTHVLTARVLRLLLGGADPGSILCLTFTKAGAAEMADRIHARLASWVRLADNHLSRELFALGEKNQREDLAQARTLFARVLDATGGGLRIQTIHAFAQSLLASFPAEAGITPGFQPLDARAERLLARQVLADLLVRAEEGGDLGLIDDVRVLSRRLGEAGAEALLMQAARAPDAMAALGPRQGMEARLRGYFGVPADLDAALVEGCGDACFGDALARVAAANRAWGAATGHERADRAEAFMALHPGDRVAQLAELAQLWLTKDRSPRTTPAKLLAAEPDYHGHLEPLAETVGRLLGIQQAAALVTVLAAGLRAGHSYASSYADAKRAAGAVDFDDLIRGARDLLATPGMGEWVRYKLDQRTDHILVDEAQDTNAAQWAIVGELAEEFFQVDPGEVADRTRKVRTLFTVGDFKQAIFGFQGTEPKEFERARRYFQEKAEASDQRFANLSLDVSFRSSPPVLDLVNQLVRDVGAERLGLAEAAPPHSSFHTGRSGSVTLWKPYSPVEAADEEESEGEEGWINDATRGFATRLARQVRQWLDDPFFVHAKGRPLKPEDILILVRRRGELAGLLVARLHAEGVPVAGVDRLRLDAPLAVKDLLAAMRFAAQPLDDLNLANLLVSPLLGMTQDGLMDVAAMRDGASLWSALRDRGDPASVGALRAMLAMADFTTPHEFLETLLSGPLDGRRKLVARLGEEARDPIEELVTAALEFESASAPSLQSFIDWFERGEVEIVRDPASGGDAVRVMTVHGAKGLQAPVVILADATADPERSPRSAIHVPLDDGARVPLFRPRKAEMAPPLTDVVAAIDERDRQEHWRLLYVAATRAEERLVIAGALGPACKGEPPKNSWFPALEASLAELGAEPLEDKEWGYSRCYQGDTPARAAPLRERKRTPVPELAPPAWLWSPAPAEARPPRPLAPSSLGADDAPDPPPGPAMRAAALRGSHLHALFERLPAVPPQARRGAGDDWLRQSAGVTEGRERGALLDDALRVIEDPAFADLFGPDALAEAPLTAVLPDGTVVSGTVDRLLVTADAVRVVDFKTGRAVPASSADIPAAYMRQMRAYAAALAVIFPGRAVEAALLFTSGPRLFAVDAG